MSLVKIQNELKAPKTQTNAFGKYKYRNCEDILEAVKPLLLKYNATLTVNDELVMVGDRYYIRATASLIIDALPTIHNTAYARESESKKGMDDSQITGTASSYARKYALNGLFLIDDTKDADSMDNTKEPKAKKPSYTQAMFDDQKMGMVKMVKDKTRTPKIIIDNLEKGYIVSDSIKKIIEGIK